MFALPSPAIHHDGGKSSHDPTESILVASAAHEWRDIASALFDREIEVAIIDWRYALRCFPVPNPQGNTCDDSKSNYVKHVTRIGKIEVAGHL